MIKPAWIKEITTIGWDLDGTLYPPGAIPTKVFHDKQLQTVADKNHWSLEQALSEYVATYDRLGSHTKTLTNLGVDGVDFFSKFWDELDLKQYIKKDLKVARLLDQLKGKFSQFLITNAGEMHQVDRKLKLIGINKRVFSEIVLAYEVGAKPDPASFLKTLEMAKCKPEEFLYIGDRDSTDILGAQSVGMHTCLVWGKSKVADVSLPTVYEVENLIG